MTIQNTEGEKDTAMGDNIELGRRGALADVVGRQLSRLDAEIVAAEAEAAHHPQQQVDTDQGPSGWSPELVRLIEAMSADDPVRRETAREDLADWVVRHPDQAPDPAAIARMHISNSYNRWVTTTERAAELGSLDAARFSPNGASSFNGASPSASANTLLNIGALAEAREAGQDIYLCMNADIAERLSASGLVTTAVPAGFEHKHAWALRGATRVRVIAENNRAGREFAMTATENLHTYVGRVEVLTPKQPGDITAETLQAISQDGPTTQVLDHFDRSDGSFLVRGEPLTGRQQTAALLVAVALHQAYTESRHIFEAERMAANGDSRVAPDLSDRLDRRREAAEERLGSSGSRFSGREADVRALRDAVVWHDRSEVAAQEFADLREHYREEFGLLIDLGKDTAVPTVTVDSEFDAPAVQARYEADVVWRREDAGRRAATQLLDDARWTRPRDLAESDAVVAALAAWTAFEPAPEEHTPERVAQRRAELEDRLAQTTLSPAERANLLFAIDYAAGRGETAAADMLDVPVFVDPGEVVKSRADWLLARSHSNRTQGFREVMREQIALLPASDQELVNQASRRIAAGDSNLAPLWPDYPDRGDLDEKLALYAGDVEELNRYAAGMFTDPESVIDDEIQVLVGRLDDQRRALLTAAYEGEGLHSAESAQMSAVVRALDLGTPAVQMPTMMWLDELALRDTDYVRHSDRTAHVGTDMAEQVAATLAKAGLDGARRADVGSPAPAQGIADHVDSLKSTLQSVATGSGGGMLHARLTDRYKSVLAHLGEELAARDVPPAVQQEVRAIIETHARTAGAYGNEWADHSSRWNDRTTQATSVRDQAAQYAAAASFREYAPAAILKVGPKRPNAPFREQATAVEQAPQAEGVEL